MEPDEIQKIESFKEDVYKDISLALLTAYSLYWLEEWMIPTSIEAVSILNFKLFPYKFAMVGFPDYPDSLRTNRSLLQLGPKYRNLLSGAAKKGFFLNNRGREEVESLIDKTLGVPKKMGRNVKKPKLKKVVTVEGSVSQPRTIHPEDTINRVKNSTLFKLFQNGEFEDPPIVHLLGLLQLYDNAPSKEKRTRLKNIDIAAKKTGDTEVKQFVELVRTKFAGYIERN